MDGVAKQYVMAWTENDSKLSSQVAADTLETVFGRNETAASGCSLLFAAVAAGDVEAASALRAAGYEWRDGEISTLLDTALNAESPAMIEALAKSGVDLSSFKDFHGDSYIHLAAGDGKVAVVNALLDGGVDIEMKGDGGWTALHYASVDGHLSTVELLLRRGAAANVGNDYQSTPLHWAVARGHKEVIAALCAAGADLNKKDLFNRTPFCPIEIDVELNRNSKIIEDKRRG